MKIYMKVASNISQTSRMLYKDERRAVKEASEQAYDLRYEPDNDGDYIVSFSSVYGTLESVYVKEVEVIE